MTVVEPSDAEGYLFVPPMPDDLDIDVLEDDVAGNISNCDSACCTSLGDLGCGCVYPDPLGKPLTARSRATWLVGPSIVPSVGRYRK